MSVTIVGNVITATGTLNDTQYKLAGSVQVSGDDARLDYAPAGPFFASFETPAFTGCDTPPIFNYIPESVTTDSVFESVTATSTTVVAALGSAGFWNPLTTPWEVVLSLSYGALDITTLPEESDGWCYVEGRFSRSVSGAGFKRYEVSMLLDKAALQRVLDDPIYPSNALNDDASEEGRPWVDYPCGFTVNVQKTNDEARLVWLVLDPASSQCVWVIEVGFMDYAEILAPVDPTGELAASVQVNPDGTLTLSVGGNSQTYTTPGSVQPDKLIEVKQALSAVTNYVGFSQAISFRNAVGTN